MEPVNKSKFSLKQVLMAMSAIAYVPLHSLHLLQENLNDAPALEQAYTAIWWVKNASTIVYVAKNNVTGDYAVIFKGPAFLPELSFLIQLYDELGLSQQESLPHSRLGAAKVASGIRLMTTDVDNSTYGGRTLHQLLNNLPAHTKVYMAGHSLGGSIAVVYAAKAACSLSPGVDIIPYTFGAPASGNDAFAGLFDPESVNCLFPLSCRFINSRDIMPSAWSSPQAISTVDYGNIKCSVDFSLGIEYLERLLILSRVFYAQPPSERQLKGEDRGTDSFFREALYQHQPNTYMHLFGLEPIDKAEFYTKEKREFILADSL